MKATFAKTVDMPEIPKTCDECPFHYTRAYQCHNERGLESFCELGYMRGYDTRDFWFNRYRFEHCQLERDYEWENNND